MYLTIKFQKFVRPLESSDWRRFERYQRNIRCLSYQEAETFRRLDQSVFDDIAERVLKNGTFEICHGECMLTVSPDPSDLDAKYVHFFHEKIPSRLVYLSVTNSKVPFT